VSYRYRPASCEPVTDDFNNDRHTTIGVACRGGSSITWNLMNILAGGSPQITASFGDAASRADRASYSPRPRLMYAADTRL
jgi:hypothetical protein